MSIIMPAFYRFPEEAAIIGRLLAGYGEIELEMSLLSSTVLNDRKHISFRAIFKMRNESQRIDLMDTLLSAKLGVYGLAGQYGHAAGAIRHCRTIRNQFAHCHWTDFPKEGLFFTNLQEAADSNKSGDPLLRMRHVDVPLLSQHETFFSYAEKYFMSLRHAVLEKRAKKRGRPYNNPWPLPKPLPLPPLHNPPEKHPAPLPSAGR